MQEDVRGSQSKGAITTRKGKGPMTTDTLEMTGSQRMRWNVPGRG